MKNEQLQQLIEQKTKSIWSEDFKNQQLNSFKLLFKDFNHHNSNSLQEESFEKFMQQYTEQATKKTLSTVVELLEDLKVI